jgi:hypothetical protein
MSRLRKSTKKITAFQKAKTRLREILEFRSAYPLVSKHTILLTGCQRSGTTLSFLMLNTHPKIQGFDETQIKFRLPSSAVIFYNQIRGYLTCVKLPEYTSNIEYIKKYLPDLNILWIVRNPYSVISSMRSLKNAEGSWIDRCAKNELYRHADLLPEIRSLNLDTLDEVSLGSYVWKYKNILIDKFRDAELNIKVFKYEDLLADPRSIMSDILDFVNLEWSENVLNHQNYYTKGQGYAGGTKGNKPLEKSRQKPEITLLRSEIDSITFICHEQMNIYGYYPPND